MSEFIFYIVSILRIKLLIFLVSWFVLSSKYFVISDTLMAIALYNNTNSVVLSAVVWRSASRFITFISKYINIS